MKKVLILSLLFISIFSNAQSLSLNSNERNKVMDEVVALLENCITNFDGKYVPGTTISEVYQMSGNKYQIEGTVSYRGEQCGLVKNTEYKITIIKEGSRTFPETCIKSPYCFMGVQTSIEWDCECKKWQYNSSNAVQGASKLLLLLNQFSRN